MWLFHGANLKRTVEGDIKEHAGRAYGEELAKTLKKVGIRTRAGLGERHTPGYKFDNLEQSVRPFAFYLFICLSIPNDVGMPVHTS